MILLRSYQYNGEIYRVGPREMNSPEELLERTLGSEREINEVTVNSIFEILFEAYKDRKKSFDPTDMPLIDDLIEAKEEREEKISIGTPKYNYGDGKYGFDYSANAEKIRADLGIPATWTIVKSKNDPGIKFVDPSDPVNSHIRISPGTVGSEFPASQIPNVKWYKKGAPMDGNGKKMTSPTGDKQNRTPEGHIHLHEFKYKI